MCNCTRQALASEVMGVNIILLLLGMEVVSVSIGPLLLRTERVSLSIVLLLLRLLKAGGLVSSGNQWPRFPQDAASNDH